MSLKLSQEDFFDDMQPGLKFGLSYMTIDMDHLSAPMFNLSCALAHHNQISDHKALYRFSSSADPMDSEKIRLHFRIPVSSYDPSLRQYLEDDPDRVRLDVARNSREKLFQSKNGKSAGAWKEVDYSLVDYLTEMGCLKWSEETTYL